MLDGQVRANRLNLRRIRGLMAERGLTHAAIAQRIGVQRVTFSRWMGGMFTPQSFTSVLRLAQVLDVDVVEIVEQVEAAQGAGDEQGSSPAPSC